MLQHDRFESAGTRVIVPLLEPHDLPDTFRQLNPELLIEQQRFILVPQFLATITVGELERRIGNIVHERDRIIRAVDALLSGF